VTYPPPDPWPPPPDPAGSPWQQAPPDPNAAPWAVPVGEPVYAPQPYPYPPQQQPYGYGYGYGPYGPYGPPPPRPPRIAAQSVGWVLLGSAVVLVVASFMTWASVFGIAIKGTDGNGDGNATLVFGIVIGAMAIVICCRQGRLWTSIVACVFASLATVVGLVDLVNVSNVASNAGLDPSTVDVGAGLWLSALAALLALAASIVGIARRQPMMR
jgi:hypothetical protein